MVCSQESSGQVRKFNRTAIINLVIKHLDVGAKLLPIEIVKPFLAM